MIAAVLFRACEGRAKLLGSRCGACAAHAFPPRRFCGACAGGEQHEVELSGGGTVRGFTEVGAPPAGFSEPYLLATVDLDEGPRVLGLLLNEPVGSNRVIAVPHPVRDGEPGFAFDRAA
jgi:uncharacterized OB-fold protein